MIILGVSEFSINDSGYNVGQKNSGRKCYGCLGCSRSLTPVSVVLLLERLLKVKPTGFYPFLSYFLRVWDLSTNWTKKKKMMEPFQTRWVTEILPCDLWQLCIYHTNYVQSRSVSRVGTYYCRYVVFAICFVHYTLSTDTEITIVWYDMRCVIFFVLWKM